MLGKDNSGSTATRIDRLADEIGAGDWREVLHAAPRHLFIPDIALAGVIAEDPDSWISRDRNSAKWLDAVYSDTAIVTQLSDGTVAMSGRAADPFAIPTCSCSAPSLVIDFLRLLDLKPGEDVLEIGTGTGWTAALLSLRVGSELVTTVEVDQAVAAQAAENLSQLAMTPRLITGDGSGGWPDQAPYSRLHVTCGVRDVPYAWVEQTTAGGVIAFPWMPEWGNGHMVRLTVMGGEATGTFHGDVSYMMLRSQRTEYGPIQGEEREYTTALDPRDVARSGSGLQIAIAGMLPGVSGGIGGEQDNGSFRLAARAGESHVLAIFSPGREGSAVTVRGPRDLWNEIETAYGKWVGWGRPGRERFGMCVTSEGQRIWLDSPDNFIGGS